MPDENVDPNPTPVPPAPVVNPTPESPMPKGNPSTLKLWIFQILGLILGSLVGMIFTPNHPANFSNLFVVLFSNLFGNLFWSLIAFPTGTLYIFLANPYGIISSGIGLILFRFLYLRKFEKNLKLSFISSQWPVIILLIILGLLLFFNLLSGFINQSQFKKDIKNLVDKNCNNVLVPTYLPAGTLVKGGISPRDENSISNCLSNGYSEYYLASGSNGIQVRVAVGSEIFKINNFVSVDGHENFTKETVTINGKELPLYFVNDSAVVIFQNNNSVISIELFRPHSGPGFGSDVTLEDRKLFKDFIIKIASSVEPVTTAINSSLWK